MQIQMKLKEMHRLVTPWLYRVLLHYCVLKGHVSIPFNFQEYRLNIGLKEHENATQSMQRTLNSKQSLMLLLTLSILLPIHLVRLVPSLAVDGLKDEQVKPKMKVIRINKISVSADLWPSDFDKGVLPFLLPPNLAKLLSESSTWCGWYDPIV